MAKFIKTLLGLVLFMEAETGVDEKHGKYDSEVGVVLDGDGDYGSKFNEKREESDELLDEQLPKRCFGGDNLEMGMQCMDTRCEQMRLHTTVADDAHHLVNTYLILAKGFKRLFHLLIGKAG